VNAAAGNRMDEMYLKTVPPDFALSRKIYSFPNFLLNFNPLFIIYI
jgi:hypothetical protein